LNMHDLQADKEETVKVLKKSAKKDFKEDEE
jgi:hypothetical protein